MCMSGDVKPQKTIIPESVKRVSKDQRRATAENTDAAATAASATNVTGTGATTQAPTQKKSLLGA